MKSILGFSAGETPEGKAAEVPSQEESRPVRSLVTVRFPQHGAAPTYYNDRFALAPGDYVFVSGKLAGQAGVVETVTTKFRIRLADYQRVISKACSVVRGSYEPILDKMVSYDRNAMSPEAFRSWILPPVHREDDSGETATDEIIVGEGYALSLSDPERSEEIEPAVLRRALDYCSQGKLAYISVRDGLGTAFVEGSAWYELSFRLQGHELTEMYCDCPYPGLCKHLLALAITLRAMEADGLDLGSDFVAVEEERFWRLAARTAKKVTLE